MLKRRRILRQVLVCAIVSSMLCGVAAMASDDNIPYSFRIGTYYGNGRDENGRYRQTSDVNNPWKVKMMSSEEGSGTITNYWLEDSGTNNVSPTISVTQGKGFHYNNPHSSANKKTVYLTAQNNNYNGTAYNVSGYWDEEIW